MPAYKAVYVTGAPASGKSSTITLLKAKNRDIKVWEYGARLTQYLQDCGSIIRDQSELRARSAGVAMPDDIDAVDDQLLAWTAESRKSSHSIIDSHPVTKETFGYRVTAFSAERFRLLNPDEIWLFYVAPEITVERISMEAAGRPVITEEEARIHSAAQASVACTFGIISGCPVYMFDTNIDQTTLVDQLAGRLGY